MGFYEVDSLDLEVLIDEIKAPLYDKYFNGKKISVKCLPEFLSESTRRTGILYALHVLQLIPDESMYMLEDYLKSEFAKVQAGLKKKKTGGLF